MASEDADSYIVGNKGQIGEGPGALVVSNTRESEASENGAVSSRVPLHEGLGDTYGPDGVSPLEETPSPAP